MPGREKVEIPQWLWVRLADGRVVRRVLLESEPGTFHLADSLPGQGEMFADGQGEFRWNGDGGAAKTGEDRVDPFHDREKTGR